MVSRSRDSNAVWVSTTGIVGVSINETVELLAMVVAFG